MGRSFAGSACSLALSSPVPTRGNPYGRNRLSRLIGHYCSAQMHTISFLTAQEAADALRISKQTLYEMVNGGRMPAIRVGSQVRIPAEELQDWIERNRWFNGGKELD